MTTVLGQDMIKENPYQTDAQKESTQCGRLREFLADERLRESSLPKNGNQELFGEEGSWRGRTCWKPPNILIT